MHLPILLIFVYAFTTEERTLCLPPRLHLEWIGVTWKPAGVWEGAWPVAEGGDDRDHHRHGAPAPCAAAAVVRTRFFGARGSSRCW